MSFLEIYKRAAHTWNLETRISEVKNKKLLGKKGIYRRDVFRYLQ